MRACRLPGYLLLALVLCACMPTRQEVRRAESAIAPRQSMQMTCVTADRCAQPSPLLDLADRLAGSDPPRHHASLLEFGQDALLARIHMIRAARQTIDMQSYIFVEDDSGWWLIEELLAAARRGVRVRLLVDQLFSSNDLPRLAELALAHRNFSMRMYNPTFGEAQTGAVQFAAGILCCFTRFNQRMHNKLLLVDGKLGITGGRNVQNRYFDWDRGFNYRDRDLLLAGPATRDMQASFEAFWNHRLSLPLSALRDVGKLLDGPAPITPPPPILRGDSMLDLSAQADSPWAIRHRLIDPGFAVGAVAFYSDLPNKPLERNSREERALSASLRNKLGRTRDELILQTPYLVFSREAQRRFRALQDQPNPPEILVSTNSLASTDAFPVYALSHKYKRRYLREFGFRIFEYKPFPAWAPIDIGAAGEGSENVLAAGVSESQRNLGSSGRRPSGGPDRLRGPLPLRQAAMRMGMHAKSMVIDRSVAIIGTHNFDPRSDRLNTESFVVIEDAALAGALRRAILRDTRPDNAWTIARRPRPPVLAGINYSLGKVSERLPLFDIWPWRYATSFEMLPGCSPVPYKHPEFERCYRPVGDFPEVEWLGKSLYTRIITAFGAGLSPIL